MYKDINDYELLDQVADNEIATETLFDKYKPLIIGMAKKKYFANQTSGLDLNDLIQEAMIGFSTSINTYDQNKDAIFFTYARTCINRRLIQTINSANRLKHQILNESLSVDNLNLEDISSTELLSDNSNNPENLLIDDENTREIINKIEKELTSLEKQVFELKTDGFNYKEIAEILHKNPKSIDNANARIKKKAEKYLKDFKKVAT